jgi:hypothetical protein
MACISENIFCRHGKQNKKLGPAKLVPFINTTSVEVHLFLFSNLKGSLTPTPSCISFFCKISPASTLPVPEPEP